MARLLEIGVSLLALLALIWCGWEEGVPRTPPQSYREPETTQRPDEPTDAYDPVTGAKLIANALLPYDGPILWEGEEDLSSVAALELWNAGDCGIRYAEVVVQQEGRVLTFSATYIPPGGRVVVPEKDRQAYTRGAVTDISYPAVIPLEEEAGADMVAVRENGSFALTVTNHGENSISCVRIFYKQYDSRQEVYAGSVTYSVVLTDLKPGESRNLMLYRYAAGYAKVVAVVAEKEKPKGNIA